MRVRVLALSMIAACSDSASCPAPVVSLRSPVTLGCADLLMRTAECPDLSPLPPWPACTSHCNQLEEASCLITHDCHPVYDSCVLLSEPCYTGKAYLGCMSLGTAASGAACDTLDAEQCASRDDCAAWFDRAASCGATTGVTAPPEGACTLRFGHCSDEPAGPIDPPP